MQKRNRSRQSVAFKDSFVSFIQEVHDTASHLPLGPEKGRMLGKARQADIALHLDD